MTTYLENLKKTFESLSTVELENELELRIRELMRLRSTERTSYVEIDEAKAITYLLRDLLQVRKFKAETVEGERRVR